MKIAVASGKGGTGKTFVATNLFNVLSRRGEDVTLTDCDAEAPDDLIFFRAEKTNETEVDHRVPVINKDACTWCGRCSRWCNYNAIFYLQAAKVIEVIENLCHGCGACTFACNSGAITEKPVVLGTVTKFRTEGGSPVVEARMKVNEMSPVRVIKAAIKESGESGVIILDAPPGTSCPFIQTVDKADYVVLVTEPTPFGLSDLRQSVDTLREMKKEPAVIINRSDIGDRGVFEYLRKENIPLLAEIKYDPAIARTYSEGRLVTDEIPALSSLFEELVEKILDGHGTGSYKR
ncbi:MAG: ATP-binding protein [Bacteroidales bacterium]|jgi:MinD superfamily P-loop ATPase|nr:ATP-binding protein [Bacteroidales bacterium]